MATKTAFITITGKPNVGKSTLLNALIGEKVAIVSRRPQTTRNRITGVLTKGENQYVFIDTPGLHRPKNLLGEYMMRAAGNASQDADITLFVMDAGAKITPAERDALKKLSQSDTTLIIVMNKVDAVNKGLLAKNISDLAEEFEFHALIPLSAKEKDGVDIIFEEIDPLLVESVHFFPDDMITDQPERQLVAELIREKVLRLTDEEVPHGVAVAIEEFKEDDGIVRIRAEIFCEKEAHKKILIGKNGAMLKKIGTYARLDAEEMLGTKVHLELWVKVKENWRDRKALLADFGYNNEE